MGNERATVIMRAGRYAAGLCERASHKWNLREPTVSVRKRKKHFNLRAAAETVVNDSDKHERPAWYATSYQRAETRASVRGRCDIVQRAPESIITSVSGC